MQHTQRTCRLVLSALAAALLCVPASVGSGQDDAAENTDAAALLVAAGGAVNAGETEDAGFYFFAAQLRYQIDKKVYPPVGKGGDSPGTLITGLSFAAGQPIVTALESDPAAYERAIARLLRWSPQFGEDYDPGWEYTEPLVGDAVADVVAETRETKLTPLRHKAVLLANEEYSRLSRELSEASLVKQRYRAALYKDVYGESDEEVTDELVREYAAARLKGSAAWTRMKQIEWDLIPEWRWHAAVGWRAEEYFTDPAVIALCRAIERDDLGEMKRLVESGANVNAVGKDGMTPLLWSFPDRKPERFAYLLEQGADPNVAVDSDFGVGQRQLHPVPADERPSGFVRPCRPGLSVTQLACGSPVLAYMQLVFEHGGDPSLTNDISKDTPLCIAIGHRKPSRVKRIELLLSSGADPNQYSHWRGVYPATLAVHRRAYDAALVVLKAGAKPDLAGTNKRSLVKSILLDEQHTPFSDPQLQSDYDALVTWLQENNAPFDRARADLSRSGRPWGKELKRQREAERAKRRADEEAKNQKRFAILQTLKSAEHAEPESAEQWVEELDASQLDRIALPDDPSTEIFVMYSGLYKNTNADSESPLVTIYADGRIVCRSRFVETAKPVSSKLTRDELTWLMHLAVNECRFLDVKSSDFELKKSRGSGGEFRLVVTLKSATNELRLPSESLIVKPLRRKLGLNGFKELNKYAESLVNSVNLAEEGDTQGILDAVNKKLAEEHPQFPLFGLRHLALADHLEATTFSATFERDFDYGEHGSQRVFGSYVRKNGEAAVTIFVR